MTNELIVNLPLPHEKQLSFMRSPAKRKVVCAGRRGGKTTGMVSLAVESMLSGKRVLEAAPTSDQTNVFWTGCKRALVDLVSAGVVYKNETERVLEIKNGGRIRTKTAWDADSLRGDHADLLILDEYSIMNPDTWTEVGAPMLLDNDGDAVFIFTPKRKNHAHKIYHQAMGDTTGRWAAFHFTSHDNPYLSKDALEEITSDMTEETYRQEVLAEFLEGEGAVFRNIAACMSAPVTTPSAHVGHTLIAGVDWGKQNDFTTVSIGCTRCKAEVVRDRFNQIDYVFQRDRLKILFAMWQPAIILAESNSIGQPNLEMLQRDGLPVIAFETTATTKPPLIENLALAFERTEWQFQDDPVWTGEIEAYERIMSHHTGRSRYSAPVGMHDDTVIARALMLWQAQRSVMATPLVQGKARGW